MGRQKKILTDILNEFTDYKYNNQYKFKSKKLKLSMRLSFQKSLNKKDLTYRILNECVLSNDEIIELLRILYNKKESKKNEN